MGDVTGTGSPFPGRVTTHQLGYGFPSALCRLNLLPTHALCTPGLTVIRDYTGFWLILADPYSAALPASCEGGGSGPVAGTQTFTAPTQILGFPQESLGQSESPTLGPSQTLPALWLLPWTCRVQGPLALDLRVLHPGFPACRASWSLPQVWFLLVSG